MHLHLRSARTVAAELSGVHVHKAYILFLHETLAAKSRGTQDKILTHADRKVSAVAVGVSLGVDTPPHLADILFDLADCRTLEKRIQLLACTGLLLALPVVRTVHKRRIYVKFAVHDTPSIVIARIISHYTTAKCII